MFKREDWTQFRTIAGLCQKAGVSPQDLWKVVLKELVDNALDATETCTIGPIEGGGHFVEDNGPGIEGEVAELFSIGRPLMSSKLVRLPTRGALGNGLRVVAGAVLASGGELRVRTKGQWRRLIPRDGGETDTEFLVADANAPGTRVEILWVRAFPVTRMRPIWPRTPVVRQADGGDTEARPQPSGTTATPSSSYVVSSATQDALTACLRRRR